MSDTPSIILHNSNTAALARWIRAVFPRANYRECNSYEDLPDLVDSYQPEVVYSVRFAGTPGFPRDALFGLDGPS